jgi:EAL domain-containing protein (putative c-di-GMP-specific phosphodiesterase class I)
MGVVRRLVRLLRDLELRVVAERIEAPEDVRAAMAMGVADMQGWYYAMAMPLEALLDARRIQAAAVRQPLAGGPPPPHETRATA